jgi:hypothetical protein
MMHYLMVMRFVLSWFVSCAYVSFHVPANPALRDAILFKTHDAEYAGHVGVNKTYERLQRLYWWPSMKSDVHTYVTVS